MKQYNLFIISKDSYIKIEDFKLLNLNNDVSDIVIGRKSGEFIKLFPEIQSQYETGLLKYDKDEYLAVLTHLHKPDINHANKLYDEYLNKKITNVV